LNASGIYAVKILGPDGSSVERIAFREARKGLCASIRKFPYASVDNDRWDVQYRIVSGRLGREPPGIAAIGCDKEVADHLFLTMPVGGWRLTIAVSLSPCKALF